MMLECNFDAMDEILDDIHTVTMNVIAQALPEYIIYI
jgi:hypothetical protein